MPFRFSVSRNSGSTLLFSSTLFPFSIRRFHSENRPALSACKYYNQDLDLLGDISAFHQIFHFPLENAYKAVPEQIRGQPDQPP